MEVTGGKRMVLWEDYDKGIMCYWWLLEFGPVDKNIDRTNLKAILWDDDELEPLKEP